MSSSVTGAVTAASATAMGKKKSWLQVLLANTGPQQFLSGIPFAPGSPYNVPKPIPVPQPLAFLHMRLRGRLTVGVANYTVESPESLLNLLMGIKLVGTHNQLGNVTLFNTTGANLFRLAHVLGIPACSVWLANAALGSFRVPNSVWTNPLGLATYGIGQFANSPWDFDVMITRPFFPLGIGDAQAALYALNELAWGQSLQLNFQFGDKTAIGTPGGTTTVAFSAYGSGAGSPSLDLMLTYLNLADRAADVGQAVSVLNDNTIPTGTLSANGNLVRLALLQNQKTTALIVKTGTILAATGGSIFATLSDGILDQTIARLNNNPIRNLISDRVTREFYAYRLGVEGNPGYLPILFDDGFPANNSFTALRGNLFPGSQQFDVAASVIGAAGTNGGNVLQEYILGKPVVASGS
jgi:hypothetical protein